MSEARPDHLIFQVETCRLGLPLAAVERVEQAAAVTPIPGAPAGLLGALNHRGHLLPVLDLRARLGLTGRPLRLEDQLILVRTGRGQAILPVDRIEGLEALGEATPGEALCPGLEQTALVPTPGGILILQALDLLLDPAALDGFQAALASLPRPLPGALAGDP